MSVAQHHPGLTAGGVARLQQQQRLLTTQLRGQHHRHRSCRQLTAAAARPAGGQQAQGASLYAENEDLMQRLLSTPLPVLMEEAAALRDQAHPRIITFSPKVFIPLTQLCRDSCGYCTFARPPQPGRRAYMTLQEVLQVAQLGAAQGCCEALFTLGDKPELLYPEAAAESAAMGYGSTLEYVEAAAAAVLQQTGLIPHINAGVMSEQELRRLKAVSGSQGLMLEGTSPHLTAPGGPHWACPDKEPQARLDTLAAAGAARVPFTTGLLIGLGEDRQQRLQDLLLLHQLHQQYGHIQEVIIQNFRSKPHTAMQHHQEPPLEELLWTVAAARIVLGPHMSIQAPPNLTPALPAAPAAGTTGASSSSSSSSSSVRDESSSWRALIDAGINDWGGISPVTRDYVNPEKPWPHISALAAATADAGKLLLPRLPVYPAYIQDLSHGSRSSGSSAGSSAGSNSGSSGGSSSSSNGASSSSNRGSKEAWLSQQGGPRSVAAAVHRAADSSGLLRANAWVAGRPAGSSSSSSSSGADDSGVNSVERDTLVQQEQHSPARDSLQQQMHSLHSLFDSANGTSTHSTGSEQQQQQRQHIQHQGQQSQSQPAGHAATPLPRLRASKLWSIAVDDLGVLEGMPEPQQVSPRIQQLLQQVLNAVQQPSGHQQQQHGQQEQQLQHARHATSTASSGSSSGSASDISWSSSDVEVLLSARGVDMAAVVAAADALRRAVCGDRVTYVVNRNINYTNVCTYACKFCAFSKGKSSEALRGAPYLLPLQEITRRAAEAWDRGATEVCLQGGIHPDFTGQTYLDILAAAKAGAPAIHVHAFSPLEVTHGAATLGLSLFDYLTQLKAAGLGSLPGTAAEVLNDDVRALLCPDKLNSQQWLEVVETAHAVGLRTTSTIMFGHIDSTAAWAQHLLALRDLQARTGGITEFVPLPFVHMEAPIYLAGGARRGPTLRECVLLHAVARLVLHPHVTNIQASWVKMGPQAAGQLLAAGCNDMGGSIMNESITKAAGAAYGQELPPQQMQDIIQATGRVPQQRTTLYGTPPQQQTAKSFVAAPLQPLVLNSGGTAAPATR